MLFVSYYSLTIKDQECSVLLARCGYILHTRGVGPGGFLSEADTTYDILFQSYSLSHLLRREPVRKAHIGVQKAL